LIIQGPDPLPAEVLSEVAIARSKFVNRHSWSQIHYFVGHGGIILIGQVNRASVLHRSHHCDGVFALTA